MRLEICPSCGVQDSIFLSHGPAVGLDGRLYGGRTEAFCNNISCDQLYWYYPCSGRITRRTIGMTYAEYRRRRVDVDIINVMRRNEGLTPLVELDSTQIIDVSEMLPSPQPWPWYRRLLATVEDWYYYFLDYWHEFRPFRKRPPEPEPVSLGMETINEVRGARGLDSINEVPDDE